MKNEGKGTRYSGTTASASRRARNASPPFQNRLLATLPESSRRQLYKGIEGVELVPKQVLHGRNTPFNSAYFPTSGLITLMMPINGRAVEISMIGDEGMLGLPLLFGVEKCPMIALAQAEGEAIRMDQEFFREQVQRNAPFSETLGRYAQTFMVILAQGIACNCVHVLEQRCARWLLMAQDRLHRDDFALTQEMLAQMLAVRRPSVSEIAGRLQERGLIRYRQGHVSIIDRKGLEALSCTCYSVIRRELDWITSALGERPDNLSKS